MLSSGLSVGCMAGKSEKSQRRGDVGLAGPRRGSQGGPEQALHSVLGSCKCQPPLSAIAAVLGGGGAGEAAVDDWGAREGKEQTALLGTWNSRI